MLCVLLLSYVYFTQLYPAQYACIRVIIHFRTIVNHHWPIAFFSSLFMFDDLHRTKKIIFFIWFYFILIYMCLRSMWMWAYLMLWSVKILCFYIYDFAAEIAIQEIELHCCRCCCCCVGFGYFSYLVITRLVLCDCVQQRCVALLCENYPS